MASIGHHLLLLPPPLLLPIRRLQTTTTVGYTEVSTREATWVPACDESGKEYTDIIYEKAVGEGIAKGNKAFCSGGDQALRSSDGYADFESFGHLNVLDLQVWIPRLPKPVIAMVAAGYAVGGGHILHMVCDFYYCC